MTPKQDEEVKSIAVIGNYLPRQCGIATFTSDLVEGLSSVSPNIDCWTMAMNDTFKGYLYPEKVRFEINQNILADYGVASQFLNISEVDIVCIQHEFGIFEALPAVICSKLLGDLHDARGDNFAYGVVRPCPEYWDVSVQTQ